MLLDPTEDQQFFRETTARFLADRVPVDEVRRLRNEDAGFDEKYWRDGAELGWTSLLVREEHGGGTISGHGLVDLTLVAHEFGRHAAPGPLLPTNVVAGALSDAAARDDVLAELLAGTAVAAWCHADPSPVTITADGDELVIDGVVRPVEAAVHADHLLVSGRTGDGATQVLLARDTPGVTVEPMRTVDLTRRFGAVRFDGARVPVSAAVGEVGGAAAQVERQRLTAVALLAAESVGAMQAAFDMTVEWAFQRYSFGRPLASYQEIKHRFADMKCWLEGSHAIADAAAAAVDAGSPDAAELCSAAKAYTGRYGTELAQDCVQIHGGIGVTFEHDLHLYLRRITVDAALHGTPTDHHLRLTDIVERRGDAA